MGTSSHDGHDRTLAGIAVSTGVVAGPVARLATPPVLGPDSGPEPDTAAAVELAGKALDAVAADLDARAATVSGQAAEVLSTQALMARDPALAGRIGDALRQGRSLPHAVSEAFGTFREALAAAGGYFAERAADLDDLRDRAVAWLRGEPMPGVPDPGHPYVLVAGDLAPADTATLDRERVLAIVTERGGPTSHTAILATALGIPAVVACPRAAGLTDGQRVLVDGDNGTVRVDPTTAEVQQAVGQADARRAAQAQAHGPGRTADGKPVALLVNLGAAGELAAASAADSEGVGLLRTEFLYLGRRDAPSQAEQRRAYAEVFSAFAGRKVVVRTLDAGADKPLPFIEHGDEPNPALGVRGLRLDRRDPALLDTQLAAVAQAAADAPDTQVWVMAPMVATPAEARDFAGRVHRHGLPVAGTMVEVPAAALRADAVLAGCDFASIGTNDLGQYTLAADRMSGELADLLDPWQPALLELVRLTAQAGVRSGKPVGVCGQAASDPLLALVLVGLGVTSLSMSPGALPAVRSTLARHTADECAALAESALRAPDAQAARASVHASAHQPT
ncbi:MAG TPA: phosphoenolpyruvate--protein phosphotransferase [Pseudonocardiaceae bacterium]|nr:phosphoenolpyruvate--protein phosphotransferase [Pseudonocardiaceae bacterium]